MAPTDTHPVRVRIREVTYAVLAENVLGHRVVDYKVAYGPGRPEIEPTAVLGPDFDPDSDAAQTAARNFKQGELILLLDDDYIRLINGNAVVDADGGGNLPEPDEEVLDVRTASVDDLARWIEQEKPNVNDTVQASGGEADLAKKLLEAESQATDGDPRRGVLEGLTAVISRG